MRATRATLTLSMLVAVAACGGKTFVDTSNAGGGGSRGHGGASGVGGGASAGGQGGTSPVCVNELDCVPPSNPCLLATCVAGVCGIGAAPQGTVVEKNTPADCRDTVCDGAGNTETAVDVNNVPASDNGCLVGACDIEGTAGVIAVPAGATCSSSAGGQWCDGEGHCVECLDGGDCDLDQACGSTNHCTATSCTNQVPDGTETDVDCGGGSCPSCEDGESCQQHADCASKLCDPVEHTCASPSCGDGQMNGAETDVDCGGPCKPCSLTKHCKKNQDCESSACDAWWPRRCVASPCSDHHVDSDETSRDCGGSCPACPDYGSCEIDADCLSTACDKTRLFCLPPHCVDGMQDDGETDIDCGGGTCPRCELGQRCDSSFECISEACDALSATCIADHCLDHHKDGDETGVDCGGPNACARCQVGSRCQNDSDCVPGVQCKGAQPRLCQ